MAERYTEVAREIFDTHDVVRGGVEVTHFSDTKLYGVKLPEVGRDRDFSVWLKAIQTGDVETRVPFSEFIETLNSMEPDTSLHLDARLAVNAMAQLWDFRCTVRAN